MNQGNKQITFHCNSYGDTHWFFMRDCNYPNNIPISLRNSWTLHRVEIMDAGYYYCYGKYGEKSNAHFLAMVEVKVYGRL